MTLFVLSIILGLAAVGIVIAAGPLGAPGLRLVALVPLALGLVCLLFACTASVGTKNVGILTTFGKPGRPLSNGLHWKAPWQAKHELSDAIQTDTYASDKGEGTQQGAQGSCINVRIARQATACVNVSIRWQIREDGVDYLFRNFKDNDAITKNVLLRDLQTTVNQTFAGYDPLSLDENGNTTQPSATTLATKVQTLMAADIGKNINVDSVLIPIFNFDKGTQDKLNQLQQQFAATRVAKQQEITNKAQAKANQALAASVSRDPGVLQSKCLDIVKESIDTKTSLPAGFNCLGSTPGLAVAAQ